MSPHRERIAWLLFVGIIALVALQVPPGVTPTTRDVEFARTLMELRQQVSRRYVRDVSDEALRDAAVRGMMQALDPFSEFVPANQAEQFNLDIRGNYYGVGILIERPEDGGGVIVVRPIEGGPAARAGVLPGDRIVGVDGQDVTALDQEAIVERVKGELGTLVTLTLERGAEEGRHRLDLSMPREEVASPVLEGYRRDAQGQPVFWVDPNAPVKLGYIRLSRFNQGSAAQLREVINRLMSEGAQGLILDLRFNPGGLLEEAVAMADLFLDEGMIFSKRGQHSPEERRYATAAGTLPRMPLVVLVNELSASASEVLAGALADNQRATIVGTRTFGKGSVQEVFNLTGDAELKLTTAYYYLPLGRLVHKTPESTDWGVVPHVEIPVDYQQQAEIGDLSQQPPYPRQVNAAAEVLLGLVTAERVGTRTAGPGPGQGAQDVRPLERREGTGTRSTSSPATRRQ